MQSMKPMMDASAMRTNTNNYKKYGMIYSTQCTKCVKEGTTFCSLKFEDENCLNFKSLDDLKIV